MNKITTFNEAQFSHLKESLSPKDYAEFINFKKREDELNEYQTKQRLEGRKKDAGQDFFGRKSSLILRRVKEQDREAEFATDDEALAYVDIHKMKKAREVANGTYEEKKTKILVTDAEINAFVTLEAEGNYYEDISLEMLEAPVTAN
jgi:hypothetical protein